MNTTSLFVELIVIGSGVFLSLLFIVLAIFGIDTDAITQSTLIASAIPALSLIYVLGIVWDRIADWLFTRTWSDGLRESQFEGIAAYYDARRVILTRSPVLSELLEYGRSRLRICRGWALIAPLLSCSAIYWLMENSQAISQSTLAISLTGVGGVALSLGCFFAWKDLSAAEYRKVREQAAYLSEQESDQAS